MCVDVSAMGSLAWPVGSGGLGDWGSVTVVTPRCKSRAIGALCSQPGFVGLRAKTFPRGPQAHILFDVSSPVQCHCVYD